MLNEKFCFFNIQQAVKRDIQSWDWEIIKQNIYQIDDEAELDFYSLTLLVMLESYKNLMESNDLETQQVLAIDIIDDYMNYVDVGIENIDDRYWLKHPTIEHHFEKFKEMLIA